MLMKVCQNGRCQRVAEKDYESPVCPDCGSKLELVNVKYLGGYESPKPETFVPEKKEFKVCIDCGRVYLPDTDGCPGCGCKISRPLRM
jgi:RNA polymerase subunit RPABC4/transcription elongation factor Spt4